MQILQQTYSPAYSEVTRKASLMVQFINWCKSQEKYRYGWLAVIVAFHGCVMTPVTVLTIPLGGNNIFLWGAAIAAMAMSLVTNLAAMPTKVTIPVFFFSILIDLTIAGYSLATFFAA